MKFASKITLFVYVLVFTSLSLAGPTSGIRNHGPAYPVETEEKSHQNNAAQGKSTSYGEIKLKHNQHIVTYLPKDVRSYQPLAYRCNDQGQRAENDVSGGCLDFVSPSMQTKWRVRFVEPEGAGERIYQIGKNGQLVPFVQFATNDIYTLVFVSDAAIKQAQANGGSPTQAARGAPTPTQTPPQEQARTDCSRLTFLERVACEAANNAGLGAPIGKGVRLLGK